jgi:hypothetical protein
MNFERTLFDQTAYPDLKLILSLFLVPEKNKRFFFSPQKMKTKNLIKSNFLSTFLDSPIYEVFFLKRTKKNFRKRIIRVKYPSLQLKLIKGVFLRVRVFRLKVISLPKSSSF